MKLTFILIILLLLSMFFIISENKLALRKEGSFKEITEIYKDWAKKSFKNTEQITGQVVKMNWSPEE